MHLLCDAIKIFEELSREKLEQDINKFCEKKKVKDVSIKIQQKSQKGYMICDRVGDGMDIYNVYLATIRYERDITQERVDEDVRKWISEKVNRKFKDLPTGPARIFNVETLQPVSVQDRIKEYVDELLASDEYKELLSRLEAAYSAPDGGEKL